MQILKLGKQMKNAIHHIMRVLIIRCQIKPGMGSHRDFQRLLVIMISKVAPFFPHWKLEGPRVTHL